MGARIGYFQGDNTRLIEDIKELKPTVFPTVPRVLYRIQDKVMIGVNQSTVKKNPFNQAISRKTEDFKKGIIRYDLFWDKTVFNAIQGALGGRLRIITTGSAPISGAVLTQLRFMLGCSILDGYDLAENATTSNLTIPSDTRARHVGPPLPCTMVKLVDVTEMNYYAYDNRGEVCLKGHNVFKGYQKDPKKTKDTLDEDGWLYTGDIDEWLPNGSLRIGDRKKNIFKLIQGEYIAPEKIENILVRSPWVAQIYVHGDSNKACIVGIVVPDPETFSDWECHSMVEY